MIKSSIGRRYASALFQLLDGSGIEPARNVLEGIARGLEESPALKHILASPVFKLEEKQAVLDELGRRAQAPAVMQEFFAQLLKKNRAMLLPEVSEAFGELADQHRGIQQVWVTSAKELDANEKQSVKTRLGQAVKHGVGITFQVDPHLIAGLQIRIGSRVFDNTIRGRLSSLQTQLTKG